ncbi:MAG: hypothetical protein AB1814_16900 [Thermodesulfobacteriota bacterium]
MWLEIEQALEALALPYARVKLYQDGLPICGKELNIVRDMAELGSPNHRLVLKLVQRGARLMGTEFAELLVREYEVMKQGLDDNYHSESAPRAERPQEILETILTERDEFIARRINDTLEPGDTGIIFLGMLHYLSPWLAKDIEVVYPLYFPRHQKVRDHV